MPYVKFVPGHTSAAGVRNYLIKNGRALAVDYLNLDAPVIGGDLEHPVYGQFDWAEAMDATRHECGNDMPWHGKPARTYKHYILSPDPADAVDLERLRALSKRWAEENFSDYEVAIVYHDDNENHIPHAHFVVNNTNLVTLHRMQDPDPRVLNWNAQRIASQMGFSHMWDGPGSSREHVHVGPHTHQHVYKRKAETAREQNGEYSWVSDIRARVSVAKSVARSETEFRKVLDILGVDVKDNSPKAARKDWIYSLQDHPTWRIGGEKLGLLYGKESIEQRLSLGGVGHLSSDAEKRIVDIARNAYELKNLGELKRLSNVVAICDQYGASSMAGQFEAISARLEDTPDAGRVSDALEFARESKVLPKTVKRTHRAKPKAERKQRDELHLNRLEAVLRLLAKSKESGVAASICLQGHKEGSSRMAQRTERAVGMCGQEGIEARIIDNCPNLAVLDGRTVWYGGLAPLAFPREGEQALRLIDSAIAHDLESSFAGAGDSPD